MSNVAMAGTSSLQVTAVVLSKSNCKFSSGAIPTLDFGVVNPSSGSTITQSVTKNFTCNGSAAIASFAISADTGLYPSGGVRRMRHASTLTEFMAYAVSLSPTSGTVPKGSLQTLTVTGTLTPSDFGDAIAGGFADTLVISITP